MPLSQDAITALARMQALEAQIADGPSSDTVVFADLFSRSTAVLGMDLRAMVEAFDTPPALVRRWLARTHAPIPAVQRQIYGKLLGRLAAQRRTLEAASVE